MCKSKSFQIKLNINKDTYFSQMFKTKKQYKIMPTHKIKGIHKQN
jgi:hypothetical protein